MDVRQHAPQHSDSHGNRHRGAETKQRPRQSGRHYRPILRIHPAPTADRQYHMDTPNYYSRQSTAE
ncbi:hypothetical protein T492DRAFT_932915 [Pavlovales sp. CCMP2436]|nr:hypothetical protein T492DRAFT_932915 [Pavlovales sp. CCMP2436]